MLRVTAECLQLVQKESRSTIAFANRADLANREIGLDDREIGLSFSEARRRPSWIGLDLSSERGREDSGISEGKINL